MAITPPQALQGSPDPSYLQYSKEKSPDKTLGSLFEGLGTVLGTTVSAVDEGIQRNIKNDARAGVDAIQGDQGVNLGVQNANSTSPAMTPKGVSDGLAEAKRLTEAQQAGRFSDTYYWGRLESLSRELRARYPGYREIIDQNLAGMTGSVPANALRRSILSEYESQQANQNAQAKEQNTFVQRNFDSIPPELAQKWIAGQRDPQTFAAIQQQVAGRDWLKGQQQRITADISTQQAQNAFTGDKAAKSFSDLSTAVVNDGITRAIDGGPGGIQGVFQRVTQLQASGQAIPPEQQQQTLGAITAARAAAEADLRRRLTSPVSPGSSATFRSTINDEAKVESIIANALKPYDTILNLVTNKEYGLAAAAANYVKASKERDMAILQNNDAWRKLQALSGLGDQTVSGAVMQTSEGGKLRDAGARAILNLNTSGTLQPPDGTNDPGQQIDNLKNNTRSDSNDRPQAIKTQMMSWAEALSNPGLAASATANAARNIFGTNGSTQDFLKKFVGPEQKKVYGMLTSPAVTARMQAVSAGDPNLWNNYRSWAEAALNSVARGEAASLQEGIDATMGGFKVVFDDKSNRFVSVPTSGMSDFMQAGGYGFISPWTSAVNGVNAALSNLEGIYRAEGSDPNLKIKEAVMRLSVNPNGSPKQEGFVQRLMNSVYETVKQVGDKPRDDGPSAQIIRGFKSALERTGTEADKTLRENLPVSMEGSDQNFPRPQATLNDISNNLVQNGRTASADHINGLNPEVKSGLIQLADAYREATGKPLPVNSARRLFEEQRAIRLDPNQRLPAATEGHSNHEDHGNGGMAFDLPRDIADTLEKNGMLARFGFYRPYPNDPVHIERVPKTAFRRTDK